MKRLMLILSCLFLSVGMVVAQTNQASGVVLDDAGAEVIGAAIIVKGTSTGTVTDADGKFSLNVPTGKDVLVISYVGMQSQEVKAARGMRVVLSSTTNLEELVVTGYGNIKKSSFTGSASIIGTEAVKDLPTPSLTTKLAGAAAGVQINAAAGQPGAFESIRIRGTGSISASNEPLYVIDGVPMINENAAKFTYADAGTSLLASLNSNDIESITIIKDAAAASLYGSRAANGVVVITTKQGAQGKTKVNLKGSWGFSDMAVDYRPTLGGDERRDLLYMGLENYAEQNGLDPTTYANQEINKYAEKPWSGWENWRDRIYQTGVSESYEASVQGGSAKTNFFSSLAYAKSEGITRPSGFQRISGRLNVNTKATDRLDISLSTTYSNTRQDVVNEGSSYSNPMYAASLGASPQDYAYNEDGTYNRTSKFPGFGGNGGRANPLAVADLNDDLNEIDRFLGSVSAKYDIYGGIYAKQVLGIDRSHVASNAWWHPDTPNGYPVGVQQIINTTINNLVSQSQLGYASVFNEVHNFDILASYEAEKYDHKEYYLWGDTFANPEKSEIVNAVNTGGESSYKQSRMISYLLFSNYNYDNKYYLSANIRRDASSRFSQDHRWATFWSVSGSWRFTQEKFMSDYTDIFSDGKIRASYGVNGNLPSKFYDYIDTYGYGSRYNSVNGTAADIIANPDLTWEVNNNLNLALELKLLNRFDVMVEYYNRDTEDLLLEKSISQTTGFARTTMNIGSMNNSGWELTLGSTNVDTKDFYWKTSLNLSFNKNKVTKLDGTQDEMTITSTLQRHKIGKDFNTFYLYEYAGVDPQTGKESYYVNEGENPREITTDASKASRTYLDKVSPDLQGGLTNTLSYKDFDLSFTFTYTLGGHLYDNADANFTGASGLASMYNRAVPSYYKMEDIWKEPGDIAKIPQFVYGTKTQPSSKYIFSTDHLRLKNVTLGYSLPKNILKKFSIENLRVFSSAVNLFTIKDSALNVDPEIPVSTANGARSYGIVLYQTPSLRSVTFGVELTF